MNNETTTFEITTDPLTLEANKAETAIAFLEEWSTWLAKLIEIFKNFFNKIAEAFNSAE